MRKETHGSQNHGESPTQPPQSETARKPPKRYVGDKLRARTPEGRRTELLLREITKMIEMLIEEDEEIPEGVSFEVLERPDVRRD